MKKDEALKYTRKLLDKHGLTDVKVGFCNSNDSFGSYRQDLKILRGKFDKRIMLHEKFVEHNQDFLVKDVIKHEVAHALTAKQYPVSHISNGGHNEAWKRNCIRLGAIPHKYGINALDHNIKIIY